MTNGKGRRFIVLALIVAAAAVALAGSLFFVNRTPPVGTGVGDTAYDFTLNDFDGNPFSLSQFRGQVVLLSFWQSTCPDCRREMPYLAELFNRYRDRGLVWVGVNLDHDHRAAEEYLKEKGFSGMQILLGEPFSEAMRVVDLLEVSLVPSVFVIDKRGIIRYKGVYPEKPTGADIERWL